jgi:hypothetical protein
VPDPVVPPPPVARPVREAPQAKNPPAEDVKGIIKQVDPTSGLVTIQLGSDAGLKKGNTLEVYRLKPKPTYRGTLRILEVRPDEAIGKPVGRLSSPIEEGDEAGSAIEKAR